MFFTSGDDDPRNGEGTGFDTIFDFPRIMGGDFSYWNRQSIRIADRSGVALVQRNSVVPDLRSSKIQGQANFVNPGLLMFTSAPPPTSPRPSAPVFNVNYLRFVETEHISTSHRSRKGIKPGDVWAHPRSSMGATSVSLPPAARLTCSRGGTRVLAGCTMLAPHPSLASKPRKDKGRRRCCRRRN